MRAGRDTEEPIVWIRSGDGVWRRRRPSDSHQTDASQIRQGHRVEWMPLEKCEPGATINRTVSIHDPSNIHQRLYFSSEEAECRGKILINLDYGVI